MPRPSSVEVLSGRRIATQVGIRDPVDGIRKSVHLTSDCKSPERKMLRSSSESILTSILLDFATTVRNPLMTFTYTEHIFVDYAGMETATPMIAVVFIFMSSEDS